MAKKQSIVNETAAAATSTARAAKPKAPRVTAAQHSKAVPGEPIESGAVQAHSEKSEDAISKIAYSYWEARGYQGGSPLEDWVRAEHEYRQRQ